MAIVTPEPAQQALMSLIDGMQERMFSPETWRAHLVAVRSVVDALIADADMKTQLTASRCPHTETEEVGTFGDPETHCTACGAHV